MKKLIQGIVDFRKSLTEENRALFSKLALGQTPDALFIACSDSRVVPNLFASTNPGDLFVLRNIGNLVPPFNHSLQDSSIAVLEFALFTLDVPDIIVCGHSECGAIHALVHGIDKKCCPHLQSWLKHGEPTFKKQKLSIDPTLTRENQISQMNVLTQMEHLASYPFIQERLQEKKLRLHGWWFDIAKADVYCFEESLKEFILIDENEAKVILAKLG